jgi:hypothetical protein
MIFCMISIIFFILIIKSLLLIGSNTVIAINDIRGIDSLTYGRGGRLIRCKLAS